MRNPNPDVYTSWQEFAKQAFWDYQAAGEIFILATARYATDYPARFHVVPPWAVEVDSGRGGPHVQDRAGRRDRGHAPRPVQEHG